MPTPQVISGDNGRAGMLRGFKSIARLLAITLGPIGGHIANSRHPQMAPELLTDAATIARRIIEVPDRVENTGAMLMRHMVWHVREEVGDGSATTAVLAQAIASEFHRVIAAGANAMMVKRGLEKATAAAIKALDELSIPLEGEEKIAAVAAASTGNQEIATLLGEMFDVLGPDANIEITGYIATFHDRAYHEGARFAGGYVSPYLITDTTRRLSILDDVHVLVADLAFESVESIQVALENLLKVEGKNILVICSRMSDKAIGVLVANNERGNIRSTAATLKAREELRRETIENIGLLVGAIPVKQIPEMKAHDITTAHFGHAERVVVSRDSLTIIGGRGDKKAIRERTGSLRKRLRQAQDAEERELLRNLLSQFSAGIGELRVGALTEQDRKAIREQAEQAIKAVQAGMESGIVPGGGAAYMACIPAVEAVQAEGDEVAGVRVLARALEEPMRCIISNSGVHAPLMIAEAKRLGPQYGYDVRSGRVVDMVEEGIVDPTMVVKRALQQASSGAMMLLTTDALVLHRKPQEAYQP